jgi:hypothetical protein
VTSTTSTWKQCALLEALKIPAWPQTVVPQVRRAATPRHAASRAGLLVALLVNSIIRAGIVGLPRAYTVGGSWSLMNSTTGWLFGNARVAMADRLVRGAPPPAPSRSGARLSQETSKASRRRGDYGRMSPPVADALCSVSTRDERTPAISGDRLDRRLAVVSSGPFQGCYASVTTPRFASRSE